VVLQPAISRRVRFAILLQLAQNGRASLATTVGVIPDIDERDLEVALMDLLESGAIEGPTWRLETLGELVSAGLLTLTEAGRLRVDEDDV
jgi:hypothetical protein